MPFFFLRKVSFIPRHGLGFMWGKTMLCFITSQNSLKLLQVTLCLIYRGKTYGERGFKSAMTRLHDLLWLRHEHNSLDTAKSYLDYPGSLSLAEWAQVANNELLVEIPRVSSF